MKKEELIKGLRKERNRLYKNIITPLDDFIKKHIEEEEKEKAEELVGRFFVYRNNCYSLPESDDDYWDVYYAILDKEGTVLKIEKDSEGDIRIDKVKMYSFPDISEDYEECSRREFRKHLDKLQSELNKKTKVLNF
ncbi:MAG: hypothetical protein ACOC5T_02335 [Elusimicrobiota bacterium]